MTKGRASRLLRILGAGRGDEWLLDGGILADYDARDASHDRNAMESELDFFGCFACRLVPATVPSQQRL